MTEDEMVGCRHQLEGHEFEQAPGVRDGQGSLVCCSPWGRKGSDTTKQLHFTSYNFQVFIDHLCFNLSFCWEFILIRSLHLLKVLTFIFLTFWWKKIFFNLLILSACFDVRKYRLHSIRYNTTLFLLFSLFLPYGRLLL